MQTQFILRMVLAVLIVKYSHAEALSYRANYRLRLEVTNDSNSFSQKQISDLIKDLGLDVDEESKIYIHEESNYIDFSCFNCIILNSPNHEIIENSFNEDFPGR